MKLKCSHYIEKQGKEGQLRINKLKITYFHSELSSINTPFLAQEFLSQEFLAQEFLAQEFLAQDRPNSTASVPRAIHPSSC